MVDAPQAFVKFFGESDNRVSIDLPVIEEVKRAGCHWSCTYPRDKRPRQARDGAVLFMGRLVQDPNDILIFGRAIGMSYKEGRDDATASDISFRSWRQKWPHYTRVHHAEFLAGTLGNGVRLSELMDELTSLLSRKARRRGTRPRARSKIHGIRLGVSGYKFTSHADRVDSGTLAGPSKRKLSSSSRRHLAPW